MGAHHSSSSSPTPHYNHSFTPDYRSCIQLRDYLNAHQGHNATSLTGPDQDTFNHFNCNKYIAEHEKSTTSNPLGYVPPPIKNVDTSNSDGDEGGAVFVYVVVAGILFVGFMWYEGSF
jgi:hypothetical protein